MNKPEQNRLRLKLVWQSLEKVNEWSLLVLREKQAALVNKKISIRFQNFASCMSQEIFHTS